MQQCYLSWYVQIDHQHVCIVAHLNSNDSHSCDFNRILLFLMFDVSQVRVDCIQHPLVFK